MNDGRLLCCPLCRGALTSLGGADGSGSSLTCADCGRRYPIVNGVPRLVAGGQRTAVAKSFGFQWRARGRRLFERQTLYGLSVDDERRNFFQALGIQPEALDGTAILDAGCGDGFLLAALSRYPCELIGFDLSASAELAARRCREFSHVTVLQADLFSPPFPAESFDYVWCEGVLVHTEDPRKGFRVLASLVKPGGRLYVWVYPSERLSIYQRIRDVSRVAHHLPYPLLLLVSYLLALPLGLAQRLRVGARRADPLATIACAIFDNLSPKVQTRHTGGEVRTWFEENGFVDLRQTGHIGMSGRKG
jgi:SAM-dependent methyltransferase/uncharacterized protein YbaR (Trm112 family)